MAPTPGHYSIRIRAIGSNTIFTGAATFTVQVGLAAPAPPPPAPPPPPPPAPPSPAPPPAPAVSPDGTTSTAPNGAALNTTAGTWAWSVPAVGRPGEYYVNLNGAAAGIGMLMEVANNGQLYVGTAQGGWYLWQNNGFVAS